MGEALHNYDRDDIEQHPVVVELRHALEVQRNVIGTIHADGEARTRSDDGNGHALRRTVDALLPMLIGIIMGALGSYATFSGRIATIETIVANHTIAITATNAKYEKLQDKLDEISAQLSELLRQRGKE